jgi:catechol 2,3-dioxygenase-like lactoylglutathione lyase family enzyme
MTTDRAYRPRFNHVAISVDPAVLNDAGRAAVLDFFSDVFGWTEGDNTGESGNPLILYTGAPLQFLYLLPAADYLTAPAMDHFGLEVASVAELRGLVERARAYQQRDPRVRIIDVAERITHGPTDDYVLTSAYIGFVIPLMVELQHIERRNRRDADGPSAGITTG